MRLRALEHRSPHALNHAPNAGLRSQLTRIKT
jgi:hypothetical protein